MNQMNMKLTMNLNESHDGIHHLLSTCLNVLITQLNHPFSSVFKLTIDCVELFSDLAM